MTPLNVFEFAEQLKLSGDSATADYAVEILEALDFVESAKYDDLCDGLNSYTKTAMADEPKRQVEWLGDRSHLLDEVDEKIRDASEGLEGDVDDLLDLLLAKLPPKLEYDL